MLLFLQRNNLTGIFANAHLQVIFNFLANINEENQNLPPPALKDVKTTKTINRTFSSTILWLYQVIF